MPAIPPPAAAAAYDVHLFAAGTLEASETIAFHPAARAFAVAAGASGTAKAGTAATGAPVVSLQKNGVEFATVSFSGAAGTVAVASATSFAAGDVLSAVAPGTADATLANVGITLRGTRA